jgi:hypothetical protein
MWVFKVKPGMLFRTRLVVRGDWQIEGVDYFEVFAPTAKLQAFRALLHLGAQWDLEMEQLDFVTAFMNGDLTDEVYIVKALCRFCFWCVSPFPTVLRVFP